MTNQNYHELLESALREIRKLRAEKESQSRREDQPIAVVGFSCRFPGADTSEQFWENLLNRKDSITEVPYDRWNSSEYYDADPDKPGKMVTKCGGFLSNVRGFDASFFGISPREARSMDPQQRLLLEVSWEALERAAIVPSQIYDKSVGVFVGVANTEYVSLLRRAGDSHAINSYFGTGNAPSVAAGRLAYFYGVHGPTFAVDTACSSSLVALHLAMQSLRRSECSMAIAGGVNLMLIPETSIHFSNARMLSPDGRCKPFSSRADGYGRSEGCGVLILKPLRDAIRDKDPITAVLRGSAINHDGRSAGLTAPNGTAQEAVIRAALHDAGIDASDVDFIEAHGTGTPLGDPIEANALARVYGATKEAREPLVVTAVKSNIGHSEAAAGVASIIKACLCLQHQIVPPNLHLETQSKHVPWKQLEFPTQCISMERKQGALTCGVSSFGFSGTNVHVIAQRFDARSNGDPSKVQSNSANEEVDQLFILSAKSEEALHDLALRFAAWLEKERSILWGDVCFTLQLGREHFAHRLALTANSKLVAAQLLRAYLNGEPLDRLWTSEVETAADWQSGSSTDVASLSNEELRQRYLRGSTIDWKAKSTNLRRCTLPTYAFQHEEFWIENRPERYPVSVPQEREPPSLLTWELKDTTWSELAQHRVFGAAIMPAVGWVYLASRLAQQSLQTDSFGLIQLEFLRMHLLEEGSLHPLESRLQTVAPDRSSFEFGNVSLPNVEGPDDSAFVRGEIEIIDGASWHGGELHRHQDEVRKEVSIAQIYALLEEIGFEYGPSFKRLTRIWQDGNRALFELDSERGGIIELLDSSLHSIVALVLQGTTSLQDATTLIPVGIHSVRWISKRDSQTESASSNSKPIGQGRLPKWGLVELQSTNLDYVIEVNLNLWGQDGEPLLELQRIRFEGFASNRLDREEQTPTTQAMDSIPQARLSAKELIGLDPAIRKETLQKHLRDQLAEELELTIEEILPNKPLAALGLDSLMVFRMGLKLESELGVIMDMRHLLQGPSLAELTETLLVKLEEASTKTNAGDVGA